MNPEYPIHKLIQDRRSLRAYSSRPVEPEKIQSLFEAPRWAPSSSNEQSWMYIYGVKGQPLWDALFDSLNEGNKIWAKDAPLLILSLARRNFLRNNRPNAFAHYDLGAANSFLSLQAVDLGLQLRQIGGFDEQKARQAANVPGEYSTGAMIAVGYPGNPDDLPAHLKTRELAPRERNRQGIFARNEPFQN